MGLSLLSERILRLKLQKASWKFISFGQAKVLAAYLIRVLLDPPFQPSVLPQVISNGKFCSLLCPCFQVLKLVSFSADFEPTVSNVPPNTEENNRTGLIVGLVVGLGSVFFLIIGAVFFVIQRRKRRRAYEDEGNYKESAST